jgi:uncharacterized protein
VGGSFLYFEPVYLRATNTSSLPEFKKVILADTKNVVWDDTLDGALAQLVGAAPPTTTPTPTPTPGGTPTPGTATCGELITQANQHYQSAQDKLKAQDLAGYAAEIQQVGALLQQMQTAGCSSGTTPASPRPSPSPSPTR